MPKLTTKIVLDYVCDQLKNHGGMDVIRRCYSADDDSDFANVPNPKRWRRVSKFKTTPEDDNDGKKDTPWAYLLDHPYEFKTNTDLPVVAAFDNTISDGGGVYGQTVNEAKLLNGERRTLRTFDRTPSDSYDFDGMFMYILTDAKDEEIVAWCIDND